MVALSFRAAFARRPKARILFGPIPTVSMLTLLGLPHVGHVALGFVVRNLSWQRQGHHHGPSSPERALGVDRSAFFGASNARSASLWPENEGIVVVLPIGLGLTPLAPSPEPQNSLSLWERELKMLLRKHRRSRCRVAVTRPFALPVSGNAIAHPDLRLLRRPPAGEATQNASA
jgi:hypothetical protein